MGHRHHIKCSHASKENVTKVDEESKVCLLGLVSMQYYFAHMLLFEVNSRGLKRFSLTLHEASQL